MNLRVFFMLCTKYSEMVLKLCLQQVAKMCEHCMRKNCVRNAECKINISDLIRHTYRHCQTFTHFISIPLFLFAFELNIFNVFKHCLFRFYNFVDF